MARINKHDDIKPRSFSVVVDDLPDLDRADLEILGEEIIDFIITRTLSGKNVNNKKFGGYSPKYMEAERKDDPPDLDLSGEMLDELKIIEIKPRKKEIVIGYKGNDHRFYGKLEGNILGTYGQPSPIPGKKRDFLGIAKSDLMALLENYR